MNCSLGDECFVVFLLGCVLCWCFLFLLLMLFEVCVRFLGCVSVL